MDERLNEVIVAMANVWGVAPEDIPGDASINEYGRWDSLGHITLLLALSDRFGFTLTPDNVQELTSLPSIVHFMRGRAAHD